MNSKDHHVLVQLTSAGARYRKPAPRKHPTQETPNIIPMLQGSRVRKSHQFVDIARALLEDLVGDRNRLLDVSHHS